MKRNCRDVWISQFLNLSESENGLSKASNAIVLKKSEEVRHSRCISEIKTHPPCNYIGESGDVIRRPPHCIKVQFSRFTVGKFQNCKFYAIFFVLQQFCFYTFFQELHLKAM